jgi:hypothetical protein
MKKVYVTLLAFALPMIAKAVESITWGEGVVTYSDSVHMALESATQTVNLSQFNASNLASHNGGAPSDFTLTKVVFSINGSISGVVEFENESPTSASNVRVRLFDLDDPNDMGKSWSRVSFGENSAVENFSASKTFATIAADSDDAPDWAGGDYARFDVNTAGSGAASTADITTDLAAFIGTSMLPFAVDFQGNWVADNLSNGSSQIAVFGDASVSVSYYYEQVPEPTSLALLGFGCAAILSRRRFRTI